MNFNPKVAGPDAVWQTHADLAAEKGIFSCEECHGEPVSAVLTFEDGDCFVGDDCFRKWQVEGENRDRRLLT